MGRSNRSKIPGQHIPGERWFPICDFLQHPGNRQYYVDHHDRHLLPGGGLEIYSIHNKKAGADIGSRF
jgi:hypothetical protein